MRYAKHLTILVILVAGAGLCRADSFAYIECWATATLTTGEPFESWRIHVVIPDGDDWQASELTAQLTGGPTWYRDWDAAEEGAGTFLFGARLA